jgi:hypothetical protein
MQLNESKFFDAVRTSRILGGTISQSEVNGVSGILKAFAKYGDGRKKTLAYALATAFHETGGQMVPVREGFARTDWAARRIVARRKYGKTAGPHGHVYYGRGHVQLTWLDNYHATGQKVGEDLVQFPDRMLDPVLSARVLIEGIIDGRWNSAKIGIKHYLPDDGRDNLKGARRTVNITDKWDIIGGYYRVFLECIEQATE